MFITRSHYQSLLKKRIAFRKVIKAIMDNTGTYEKQQFNNGYVQQAFVNGTINEEERAICLILIELLPY